MKIKKPEWIILGVVLLAGLLFRLVYLLEIQALPDFTIPLVDAGYHDAWARALVTDQWEGFDPQGHFRNNAYLRPPGYPLFLAMVYQVFGMNYWAPRIVQMLLGLLSCVLGFFLGKRLFNPSVGLILSGFLALYWIFPYSESKLQAPSLLVFLVLSFCLTAASLINKPTSLRFFGAGVLMGLFAIIRPNILIFAPLFLLWILFVLKSWKGIGISLVGMLLLIAPITLRNAIKTHDFVLISANGGVNLYIGNNTQATGLFMNNLPDLENFGTCYDYPRVVGNLERKLNRPLKYSEVSAHFFSKAMDFIQESPLKFLSLLAQKTGLFLGNKEISHNYVIACEKNFSKVLKHHPMDFTMILCLALFGVWRLTNKNRSILLLLGLLVLSYAASFILFFITSLYRIPILPLLMLPAAFAIKEIFSKGKLKALLWGFSAAALYLVLISFQGSGYSDHDLASWRFAQARCLSILGRVEEAVAEYKKAIRINPDHYGAHYNLALLLQDKGQVREAERHFKLALKINPRLEAIYCDLGKLYETQKQLDQAGACFKNALMLNPHNTDTAMRLAYILTHQNQLEEAKNLYLRVTRLSPRLADAYCNLGVVMIRLSQFERAIEPLTKAVNLDRSFLLAHYNLGLAYEATGKRDLAIQAYQRAIKIDPGYQAAQDRLDLLLK